MRRYLKGQRVAHFIVLLATLLSLRPMSAALPDSLFFSFWHPGTGPQLNAQQGDTAALDGNIAAVGAPRDATGGYSSGVVKIYDAPGGALLFTLTNPAPANDDYFGNAIALSGPRLVVGAYGDDQGKIDSGSVFVFDLSSPAPSTPILTLTNPAPATSLFFGWDVAISGNLVVVGTPYDNAVVSNAGKAWVFNLAASTPTVPLLVLTNPSPAQYDNYGEVVAISGSRVLITANGDDTASSDAGSAYLYDLTSPTPTVPILTLTNPTPAPFEYFGYEAAMSGSRVAIAASEEDPQSNVEGSVYVYELNSLTPTVPMAVLTNPNPATSTAFGYALAVSGTRIAVGVPHDDTEELLNGRAYVYDLAGPTPTIPAVTLINPTTGLTDKFGTAVALSNTRLLVGAPGDSTTAPNAGSAYYYDLAGPNPASPMTILSSPSPSVLDSFGWSVALSGTRIAVGAFADGTTRYDAGGVYVYELASMTPTTPWLFLTNPVPTGAYFGWSVALSGQRLIAGFSDTASQPDVYVYDLGGPSPNVPYLKLTNPTPAEADSFGSALCLSGTRAIVGARGDDTGEINAGSAYIFDLASPNPQVPIITLTNPAPGHSDHFGESIADSGSLVVIGAPEDDAGAMDAGSAYVFDLASAMPTVPVLTLTNPAPNPFDYFGDSIAISGTRIVIGAYGQSFGTNNSVGIAYVYELSNPPIPLLTLTNPNPAHYNSFGDAVAIAGSHVLVGATGGDVGATNAGNVYVYDLNSPNPAIPVAILVNPTHGYGDAFGKALAFDGALAIVGAPYTDTVAPSRGAAHVFGPRPLLQITPQTPGRALVSWTNFTPLNFVLQARDSFSNSWINVPGPAANPLSISTTTNGSKFFRLAGP